MSIPTRLKIKYKDGVIEDNVSFATISYGSDLNDENVWKSWWDQ